MKSFPMFIRTTGRRVVIVGGDEQAAQKTRLILKTDAQIVLVAPALDEELSALVAEGRATQVPDLSLDVLRGAAMVFVGTGCPALDSCAHALAKEAGCQVNVVDQPELCDLTTPALVDRDPIVIAIGSEGTAPVLTRDIKTRLEEMLSPNLGGLAALAGRLRGRVAQTVPRAQRRAFWAWVFKGAARATWDQGREREAAKLIKDAVAAGKAPESTDKGRIVLVGAGPGARDLLSLRAVSRLQEADVIFYDRLVEEDVLELARRDAERVFVGKHVGANAWPQERIDAAIVAEARKGRMVVRLKSGDPSVFGRATEELDAARAAGIDTEIVPGITAASAAAAAFDGSLTERGKTDTLVLTTGRGQPGHDHPDCTRHAAPGTTTAFYMSVGQAARIRADLLAKGCPGETEVRIAVNATKPDQKLLHCALNQLEETLTQNAVKGCAVILLSWAHDAMPVAEVLPMAGATPPLARTAG